MNNNNKAANRQTERSSQEENPVSSSSFSERERSGERSSESRFSEGIFISSLFQRLIERRAAPAKAPASSSSFK